MKLINTAHKKTNQFPQHPTENNLAYHLNALPILDLYLITPLWQGKGYGRKDCPLFEDGREKNSSRIVPCSCLNRPSRMELLKQMLEAL